MVTHAKQGSIILITLCAMSAMAQDCGFAEPTVYFVPDPPVGANPRFINSADLDGDGDFDLITDSNGSGTDPTQVFWNDGNGTFVRGPVLTAGWGSGEIALGDIDGDGDQDVIRACVNSIGVYFFRNQGDGIFQSPIFYATGGTYYGVEFVDFDNDGDLDFVCAGTHIRPYRNINGIGFNSVGLFDCGGSAFGIDSGDIDHDGDQDVIVANYESNTVTVSYNAGDGTFPDRDSFTVGSGPLDVVLADLDADGNLDIVSADWGDISHFGTTVSVLMGDGAGSFAPRQSYTTHAAPRSIAVADLNHDDVLDLAVSCQIGGVVEVFYGQGDGTFTGPTTFDNQDSPHGIVINDFNEDGGMDIAYVDRALSQMTLLFNTCNGVCEPDLNSDGVLDFFDVSAFLNAFNADDPIADLTGDGNFDFFDVSAFLNAFTAGCP